jgi:uncharacterized protein (DUF302 family)
MNELKEYAFQSVVDLPFEDAVEKVTAALGKEGFGVLTEIDVQATLKKKIGKDFRKYKILGACNPPFAFQALSAELDVGLLLPCNVVVYETNAGETTVGAINPVSMLKVIPNDQLQKVASEVSARLEKAIQSLAKE